MVQTCDDQGSVNETEYCSKQYFDRACDTGVNNCGDRGTDLPADGTENEVRRHNGKRQGEERYKDHRYNGRNDLSEELLKVDQAESREHCGNDLCLITDHVDLREAEIPLRNICRCCACHCISIQELSGDQRHSEDQTEHFSRAHLLGNGPTNAYRNTYVEYRLTDQPQEVVDTCPELAQFYQCVAALENVKRIDTVAETEDQTACDDGGQKRCKDLRQNRCQSLQRILVLLGGLLDRVLGNSGNTGNFRKVIIKLANCVADDYLKLT